MSSKIIGIRFQKFGKIYHFNAEENSDIKTGDYAVVETSRGKQLGEVVQILETAKTERHTSLKPIVRVATPRDLVLRQVWQQKELEAVEVSRAKLAELGIEGVKIIDAEYTFDGKRLTFLYNSEGDESVDLTTLRNQLKAQYRRTRIDLRQIGPRDVAKIIGGMGACGMGRRCCSMFLAEFSPISIRMAKAQGVSLAPSEITGMCGRLRCCLFYEYDHYVEARKELPRVKKRIPTPLGDGKVVSVSPLIRKILVDLDDGGLKEFTLEELQGDPIKSEESTSREIKDNETTPPKSRSRRRPSSRKRNRRR
jgi:cell fate regulator YaaT (PSP1 superfamily)